MPITGAAPFASARAVGHEAIRQAPGALWQLRCCFMRSLLCHYVRNPVNLGARLLCYVALSLADGLIFWRVASDPASKDDAESTLGAFTFIMMISYLLPFATIPVFVHDKHFYVRESGLGLYPSWVYTVAQAALEAWVLALAALCETILIFPLCGLGDALGGGWEAFSTCASPQLLAVCDVVCTSHL